MADLSTSDRLQPTLLDRLTDDEPSSNVESRNKRVLNSRDYRAAVLRDLQWLINTGNRDVTGDYDEFDQIQTSVLNYGVRDFSGLNVYTMLLDDMEKSVFEAIENFEPRIISDGLRVGIVTDDDGFNVVEYQSCAIGIEGLLWNMPMPEELFVKTEIDLETGACTVRDGHR